MMERRVKERLIGASILVVVIVGVVPEFLSGPKRIPLAPPLTPPGKASAVNEVRNVTVDLATNRATAADNATEPSDAASNETLPPPNPTPPALEQPKPSQQPQAPAAPQQPTPPAVARHETVESAPAPPRSAPSGDASHRGWAVQLGVFASKSNADNLVHQVKSQGAAVYVVPTGGKAARFKVRVGPLADRGAAERALAKLKAQGHPGSLVAPEG